MAQDYIIEININDMLDDVIRKCNANFRQISYAQRSKTRQGIRLSDNKLTKYINDGLDSLRDYVDGAIDILQDAIDGLDYRVTALEDAVSSILGDISGFVKKTGDTMTGSLRMKTSSIDRDGANPSTDQASNEYTFYDKDDEQIGKIVCYRRTDGRIDIHVNAINEKSDGTSVTNTFQVRTAKDGTCTYYMSSPANFRSAINAVNKGGDTMTGSLNIKSSGIDRDGSNPSSTVWGQYLVLQDKDGERIGAFAVARETDGRTRAGLWAYNEKSDGTETGASLSIFSAKDGTVTYSVQSPLAFRNAISALGRNPVSAELPHSTATSNVFPLVLGNSFANNGAISYQNPAEFRTTIGADNASNLTSGTLAPARGGTGRTKAALNFKSIFTNINVAPGGTLGTNTAVLDYYYYEVVCANSGHMLGIRSGTSIFCIGGRDPGSGAGAARVFIAQLTVNTSTGKVTYLAGGEHTIDSNTTAISRNILGLYGLY